MTATGNDAHGISSSTTTITTPSLGSFAIGSSSGSVAGGFDEEVPTAYEQVSDGKDTMANKVGDFMDNNSIVYTSPTLDVMGASITVGLGYTPQANDKAVGDGAQVTYLSLIHI